MDLKKLIQTMDEIESKKTLNESQLNECPPMEGEMPAAPANPGNPVTVSVTMNASGKEHVADLLGMMKNAGLATAEPEMGPTPPMRQDMDRLRAMVDEPEMQDDIAYSDEIMDDEELEEYENEPEEEYHDHELMTRDLSGGINREKKMYKAAQRGDNAMAVENIARELYAALSEKKAKPDFLDMDKDGNKKEPMKKAIADKKKKGPVKEDDRDELTKKLFPKQSRSDMEKRDREHNRKLNQKKFMKPGKPSRSGEWGAYESATVGGYPKKHVEQGLKLYRKSKEEGALNSEAEGYVAYIAQKKLGFSEIEAEKFAEYIADRDISLDYASGPRSDLDRENMHGALKKALAKEDQVGEISGDLAKRYTKAAKMDRDFNDDDIDRLSKSGQSTRDMHRRNAKRTKGINRAAKRIEK